MTFLKKISKINWEIERMSELISIHKNLIKQIFKDYKRYNLSNNNLNVLINERIKNNLNGVINKKINKKINNNKFNEEPKKNKKIKEKFKGYFNYILGCIEIIKEVEKKKKEILDNITEEEYKAYYNSIFQGVLERINIKNNKNNKDIIPRLIENMRLCYEDRIIDNAVIIKFIESILTKNSLENVN